MPKAYDTPDYSYDRSRMQYDHPQHQQTHPQQHQHPQHPQQHQQQYYLPSPTQPNAHAYAHQLPVLPPANGYGGYGAPPPQSSTSSTSPTLRMNSPYAHGGHSARSSPLHRGEACLTCRRRKMKCDASKPACGPCSRQGKASECEYEETRFLAQIARLEAEVAVLKERIRELESGAAPATGPVASTSAAAAGSGGNSPQQSFARRSPSDGSNHGAEDRSAGSYGAGGSGGYYEQARPGTSAGAGGYDGGAFAYAGAGTGTHTPAGYTTGVNTPAGGAGARSQSPSGGSAAAAEALARGWAE